MRAFAITAVLSLNLFATLMGLDQDPALPSADAARLTGRFTGQVTRNRVRMRMQPNLESPIIRELEQGALVNVVGEDEGFYAISAPRDLKAYIYRTYVLDNAIDAVNVNVRLEPSLESPVIAQLNKGDRIEGRISPLNSRWMEISLPDVIHFYVAKEFVVKADPNARPVASQSRREEANRVINAAYVEAKVELQKPAAEMQLDRAFNALSQAISDYSDLPEETRRAQNLLSLLQETYQQKKFSELGPQAPSPTPESEQDRVSGWLPKETEQYEAWVKSHPNKSLEDFYAEQRADAVLLRGIPQPYVRPVHNKPGNFMLLSHEDKQPIAFLYSTLVDLQGKVGQVASLVVVPRPNNNFAFPAYFVLQAN